MKPLKIMFLLVVFICMSGCGNEKYFVCTIDVDNSNENYSLNATYKVYYDGNYVTKIEKNDYYSSNDLTVLNYFKEYKTLEYDNLNSLYGGFDYSVDLNENDLIFNTTINLEDVDIKKMLSNGDINSDYVVSNKLTTSGIKYLYKAKGAICE